MCKKSWESIKFFLEDLLLCKRFEPVWVLHQGRTIRGDGSHYSSFEKEWINLPLKNLKILSRFVNSRKHWGNGWCNDWKVAWEVAGLWTRLGSPSSSSFSLNFFFFFIVTQFQLNYPIKIGIYFYSFVLKIL